MQNGSPTTNDENTLVTLIKYLFGFFFLFYGVVSFIMVEEVGLKAIIIGIFALPIGLYLFPPTNKRFFNKGLLSFKGMFDITTENRLSTIGENLVSKNPGLSAVLSFLFPGLGQIYNGEIARGISYLIGYVISWTFFIASDYVIFVIVGLTICIHAIYDAYTMAIAINKSLEERNRITTKKCPYCAERIQAEAIVEQFVYLPLVQLQHQVP